MEHATLRVVKKDGSRVPFQREKVLLGLLKACEKRPVPTESLEKIACLIEKRLYKRGEREVTSRYIGELATQRLKELDKVAYVRFASVYREFEDTSDFYEVLETSGAESKKGKRKNR